jgi:hypothetical protein
MEVFYTSSWVPPEWIKAHGLDPRGVWLAKDFACEPLPLAAGVCAFANAVVRLAERQAGSAVIFTSHCDQLRRGFDTVAGAAAPRVFLFNLPVTWQTPVAERIFADELRRLGRFLVGLGGHAPAPGDVAELMTEYSQARQCLLDAVAWCPAREYAEAVARFHLDGSVNLPPERGRPQPQRYGQQHGDDILPRAATSVAAAPGDSRAPGPNAIPLALVGGPLPESQMPLLDAIEKGGGRVVLNATEAGERSLWPASLLVQLQDNAFDLLARGYLANCVDVFQRPNTRLYDWLRGRLAARQVRGIVLWHYVGCDLWRAEAQPMREAFGLPVLLLDADEAAPNRNTGRLEAFLESLR